MGRPGMEKENEPIKGSDCVTMERETHTYSWPAVTHSNRIAIVSDRLILTTHFELLTFLQAEDPAQTRRGRGENHRAELKHKPGR